jgi:glycosyltransferase involved in cell wall biosynthesis
MSPVDVICLSHLPWAFGLERPHQVMRRFARDRHVFFVEEPTVTDDAVMRIVMRTVEYNIHIVSLKVPSAMTPGQIETAQRRCVRSLVAEDAKPLLWVYSPSLLHAARDIEPSLLVYDCVADHAARSGASRELRSSEIDLLTRADLVLTAGTSLFDAKRSFNVSTYPLPSSVDADHFAPPNTRPPPSKAPRIGFLGTIDERVDLGLVDRLAEARPNLEIVLAGGLVGITPWDLPDRPNVHLLDSVTYADLPERVRSWDVAIVPFRGDAATRRTEASGLLPCLATGRPIVTTPHDEVESYAERGLVKVVEAERFVAGVDAALREAGDPVFNAVRRMARNGVLARTSWDRTCSAMMRLVDEAVMTRQVAAAAGRERTSDAEARGLPC